MAESSISFYKLMYEAKRIINLNRRHFYSLSALLLFPLSLLSLLYLSTIQNKPNPNPNPNPYSNILLQLAFTLASNLLYLVSMSIIVYSTYHAYHGEPVDLLTSLRSVRRTFWPLVSTFMVYFLMLYLMIIPVLLSMLALHKWLHGTSYLAPCLILIGVVSGVALVRIILTWMLVPPVVVVESKWGYASLKRSASLIKGNKRVALLLLLYFQLIMGLIYIAFYFYGSIGSINSYDTTGLCIFALMFLFCSFCLSQMTLLCYVAIAVLYIYCSEISEKGFPTIPDKLVHLLP